MVAVSMLPRLVCAGIVLLCLTVPVCAQTKVDFKRDVYPLLKDRCFSCHQGSDASSGHRLDLRSEITGESNGKPLVKIGKSDESKLIDFVSGKTPGKIMPPRGKPLTKDEIARLRAWIDEGLAWDETLLPPLSKEQEHWAFQPIRRVDVPTVKDKTKVLTPVDSFIFAAQEAKGIVPASPAERLTLLRRVYLDLTGLPPSAEEIDAFVKATDPKAFEKIVNKLLASRAYGERWGRHWLDLARYADSEGYESDHVRPSAWRYRDYVVESFAKDKPYDRFLREQLAGDELLPYSDENLIATGFLAAARLSSNEEDKPRQRNDVLVDIVNTTAGAILGLTMNCAQCHSHKFDPISARDYYRFQGFFVQGFTHNLALQSPELWKTYNASKPKEYDTIQAQTQAILKTARETADAAVRKKMPPEQRTALKTPDEKRTPEQRRLAHEADLLFQFTDGMLERFIDADKKKEYDALKKQLADMEAKMPDRPETWGFYSPVSSPTRVQVLPMKGFYPPPFIPEQLARARPYLLKSGDIHDRGAEVDVGWPEVFGTTPKEKVSKQPRSALADWLADLRNPLTARVWVNRIWQHHFGRGLVSTLSDFGIKGAKPTHPELLDWLASELIRNGWSTRHIHRQIVLSETYRQAARGDSKNRTLDPDNLLWWRWQPRRLEVEAIRDRMLFVSGELDTTVGGPGVEEAKSLRRTIYLLQKRQKSPAIQGLFDGPGAATESCPKRLSTTVASQALYLLNNDFTLQRAQAIAAKVKEQAGADRAKQIEVAFRRVLGRSPDATERKSSVAFFEAVEDNALAPFCQTLIALNEFVYLE